MISLGVDIGGTGCKCVAFCDDGADVMARACDAVGVKKIRVHDIRHSHASMLVELGFSPLLIAERLGLERVQITMKTVPQ